MDEDFSAEEKALAGSLVLVTMTKDYRRPVAGHGFVTHAKGERYLVRYELARKMAADDACGVVEESKPGIADALARRREKRAAVASDIEQAKADAESDRARARESERAAAEAEAEQAREAARAAVIAERAPRAEPVREEE